jgi:iron complex outermembrane receptor protein
MQFIHYGWYRVAASMSCCALLSCAQTALAEEPAPGADAVVVSATRRDQPSLLLPAAVDRLYSDEIRFGRPQINLSESIGRVPGIVVQNRNNYTQDLQVHSRGVGARSTFGIRGLRLYQDGIPASMPDGQGQASSFDLGSAERIEVLRGAWRRCMAIPVAA